LEGLVFLSFFIISFVIPFVFGHLYTILIPWEATIGSRIDGYWLSWRFCLRALRNILLYFFFLFGNTHRLGHCLLLLFFLIVFYSLSCHLFCNMNIPAHELGLLDQLRVLFTQTNSDKHESRGFSRWLVSSSRSNGNSK
jgi:hypothetical protein